jgi:hypothetical protein
VQRRHWCVERSTAASHLPASLTALHGVFSMSEGYWGLGTLTVLAIMLLLGRLARTRVHRDTIRVAIEFVLYGALGAILIGGPFAIWDALYLIFHFLEDPPLLTSRFAVPVGFGLGIAYRVIVLVNTRIL